MGNIVVLKKSLRHLHVRVLRPVSAVMALREKWGAQVIEGIISTQGCGSNISAAMTTLSCNDYSQQGSICQSDALLGKCRDVLLRSRLAPVTLHVQPIPDVVLHA